MTLDQTSSIKILESPVSKQNIQLAKIQESQLRVFTEDLSKEELANEVYWKVLIDQMRKRSQKKFDRVIEFARYPLPVAQISDSILNDYFKVFDGKNRYFKVEGDRDISLLDDWIAELEPEQWIEKQAKKVLKNKPVSFVVLDIDDQGRPYPILVDSARLVDAKFKTDEGDLEYIAFVHSQETISAEVTRTKYSVYDDANYRVFYKDSDSDVFNLISEESHNIGYCPAKAFVKTQSNSNNPFKRRVAFSSSVSKMEDWTMFDIFRNYTDYYAPFPVTEAPKETCANDSCQDGKVSYDVANSSVEGGFETAWKDCPVCENAQGADLIFPGAHIGIKVAEDKSMADGSGVFKMIFPDTEKMKYVPEKLDDIEMEIRFKTVGVNNLSENEAMNEIQVKGSFASMDTILLRNKEELDSLYTWIVETVGRMFYKDLSVNVEANFGTEWYLISEKDLQDRYKKAKEAGLPMEEQLMIYIQLIETKYKGNQAKIDRQKMLLHLDPLPLYSITDAITFKSLNQIDDRDLSMKINFLNFIAKFESENLPITQFGLNLDYWKRVDAIKSILNIYNNEQIASKQVQTGEEGPE